MTRTSAPSVATGRACAATNPLSLAVRSAGWRPATGDRDRTARSAPSAVAEQRSRRGLAKPVASGRGGRHRPRLTARGRLAMLLLISVLLLVAFSLGRVTTSAATSAPAAPPAHAVVGPGDTLWSIALRVAPANDPRDTVQQLVRLNHLRGVAVQVGQQLALPSRS